MTLIEAIKSGRPFRRPPLLWCKLGPNQTLWDGSPTYDGPLVLTAHDVMADDWEIQEPSVTVTRNQLFEAVHDMPSDMRLLEFHPPTGIEKPSWKWIDELARRLGLEPPKAEDGAEGAGG